MYHVQQQIDAFASNTEAVITKVFKNAAGFPVSINLEPSADADPPDAPIDTQFPKVQWQGNSVAADVDLFGSTASRAQVEARIQQLRAGLPGTQVELDEHETLLKTLESLINFSADLALFSTDYNNAAAEQYLRTPNDPAARLALDRAVERALYLFPEINGESTPVRWRFPEREGDFYVDAHRRTKAGVTQIQTPQGMDFIRTDLSREAINGQVICLTRLFLAHPDAAVKATLAKAILDVLKNLQSNNFQQHIDQNGYVTDYSVVTAARRLLPRPLSALIPNNEQIDGIKGGDKLMVYSMLRCAALVDPANWTTIADDYYNQFSSSFGLTTVAIYYKFHTLTDTKTKKYTTLLGAGGLVGGIAGGVLGGALSLVGLPFLPLAMLGILAGAGGAVHILMNRKVEIDRFNSVYESIQLEQRIDAFLLENDGLSNPQKQALWQDKLGQCFILQARKMDALTTALYVDSPLGRKLLVEDLVALDQQIANVRRQLRRAKKNWCSLFTSKKRRKKFKRLQRLFDSLRVYRRLAYSTKTGAYKEVPKKILLAHYGHSYSRTPADHNAGGSLGTVESKLTALNATIAANGGLQLGASDIGVETITAFPIPGYLRTTKAFTDNGFDEFQYRFTPEAFLWNSRRSVTKHPMFRFGVGAGHIFYPPSGAMMAWAKLQKNGINP